MKIIIILLCYFLSVSCDISDIYNSGLLHRFFNTKHLHVNICSHGRMSEYSDLFFKLYFGSWSLYITTSELFVDFLQAPTYREINRTRYLPNSIVFLDNVQQLYQIRFNPFWNSRARIIVIIEQSNKINVKDVLNILWNSTRSVNVNVLVNSETYFDVYTWFPYTPNNCDYVNDVVHLDRWENGTFHTEIINFMSKKLPKNMQGCSLYVSSAAMMPFSSGDMEMFGFEDKIILSFVKYFNFTLTRIPPPDDLMFFPPVYKGKFGGSVSLLYAYKADLVYGSMRFIKLRYDLTDSLTPYYRDYLVWIVPAVKDEAYGRRIFLVFSLSLWCLVLFVHACLVLIVYIIGRIKSEKLFTHLSTCLIYLSAVSLSVSAYQTPQTFFLKYFLFFVSLYYINISTAYQSSLIVMMTKPNFDDSFKNAEDAIDAGLTLYLFPTVSSYAPEFNNPSWDKVVSGRVVFSENKTKHFEEIAINKSAMTLTVSLTGEYIINKKYLDRYGEPKAKIVGGEFILFPLSIYMSPGNPLRNPFDSIVRKISEGGFISYWATETMRVKQEIAYNNEEKKSLTLVQVAGCFYLLSLGQILSFFILLCELLKHSFF